MLYAACYRCGRIFNDYFAADLLTSLPVKIFENRLRFARVTAMSLVSSFFGTEYSDKYCHQYIIHVLSSNSETWKDI